MPGFASHTYRTDILPSAEPSHSRLVGIRHSWARLLAEYSSSQCWSQLSQSRLNSFRRLKKSRCREMSARGYALCSVRPNFPFPLCTLALITVFHQQWLARWSHLSEWNKSTHGHCCIILHNAQAVLRALIAWIDVENIVCGCPARPLQNTGILGGDFIRAHRLFLGRLTYWKKHR